jgi:hypothetical protein
MQYNQNGDKFYYNIVVSNNSPYTDTNIITTITPLPTGIAFDHVEKTQGSFNQGTLTWTIPSMPGKTTTSLRLWVTVTDVTEGPFSITYTSIGTLTDPNLANNTKTLTAELSGCAPDAGGNDDFSSCLCINVAANDTPCTYGTTEWRLNESSVVNGVVNNWDTLTGKGDFTVIDPTEPITGTYDVWCVVGVDEFQKSCGVEFTIYPQLDNKNIFDHTIQTVPYSSLSPQQIVTLSAQYPTLSLSEYCWRVLKNGDGVTTSGEPVDCDEEIDTRTFFFCSESDCSPADEDCPCLTTDLPADVVSQLPVGYDEEKGDTIVIYHANATSVWTWGGSSWSRWACGCVYKISQDEGNALTLGSDGAPYFALQDITTVQGTQGIQGLQGSNGLFAAQGIQGIQGAPGATGPAGAQGISGTAAAQGATGSTGVQGLQGNTGATGLQGIQGIQGINSSLECCCWASVAYVQESPSSTSATLVLFTECNLDGAIVRWQFAGESGWADIDPQPDPLTTLDLTLTDTGLYRVKISGRAGCCDTYSNVVFHLGEGL